jgi:hypothetical protein
MRDALVRDDGHPTDERPHRRMDEEVGHDLGSSMLAA